MGNTPIARRLALLIRRGVPVLLICLGVAMLAGCIWIPLREHPTDKTQKDFRQFADSKGATGLNIGVTSRQSVVALLGTPTYSYHGDRTIGYKFETSNGLQIWPLCFALSDLDHRTYLLKMKFDSDGRLLKWAVSTYDLGNDSISVFGISGANLDLEPEIEDFDKSETPPTQP